MDLSDSIDLESFPIEDALFRAACRKEFDETGVFVMEGFVRKDAIEAVRDEGLANKDKVFKSAKQHNVYLTPADEAFAEGHARNRLVTSSKGCITDDLMPQSSALRTLYNAPAFRSFLCEVLGEEGCTNTRTLCPPSICTSPRKGRNLAGTSTTPPSRSR